MKSDRPDGGVGETDTLQPTADVYHAVTQSPASAQGGQKSRGVPEFEPDTIIDARPWFGEVEGGAAPRSVWASGSSPRDVSGAFAPVTQQLGSNALFSRPRMPAPGGPALELQAPSGAAVTLLEGTPYRVIEPLGSGAMGEVFAVEDTEIGEPAVVKVLRRDVDDSGGERMRREAHALAKLDHPNIVAISRFARAPGGRWYIAMERLYGHTLAREIAVRGPMPVNETVHYGLQILAGLAAAHQNGLLHRDIKPANLFLSDTPDGRIIKILDFGLVKALATPDEPASIDGLDFLTAQGMFVGTPRWTAPEVVRGIQADRRADLYSVALVLLTMLSGEEPFPDARADGELLLAHANLELAFTFDKRPDPIPRAVVRVLRKAASKFPEGRYATAEDFASDLGAALTHQLAEPEEASVNLYDVDDVRAGERTTSYRGPLSRIPRRELLVAAAFACILAAALLSGISWWRARRGPSAPSASPLPRQAITTVTAPDSAPVDRPASPSLPSSGRILPKASGEATGRPPTEAVRK